MYVAVIILFSVAKHKYAVLSEKYIPSAVF